MSCRIAHAGQLSESFEVKTGVRQGCLLSPFLFLLVIDWIMKTTTSGRKKRGYSGHSGRSWMTSTSRTTWRSLSHSHSQMQDKTTCLEATSAGTGLKINRRKTELMKINTTANTPVTVEKIRNEELWDASGAGTSGQADPAVEVGLDWTHPQEASIQHHTPSPDMEPAGEKEERPASQQLEAGH
nr:hypothetical protein BaRGS_028614 [Batillaria attramentaria]